MREPRLFPMKTPVSLVDVPSYAETPQSMSGLKTVEKRNKIQAVLMLTSNLVWEAELLFEWLELSTKIPKWGDRINTDNPLPGQSPPGPRRANTMCLQLFGGSRDNAKLWAHSQGPIHAQTPQLRQLTKYMIGTELFHVKRDLSKQEKVFLPYNVRHLLNSVFLGIKFYLTRV